ncbi:MAG: DUF1850 domain-containing protein [Halomonadaceae bacterium]|nr:DUF1850 domain-containing protein [Halomonadaceae bacterium]
MHAVRSPTAAGRTRLSALLFCIVFTGAWLLNSARAESISDAQLVVTSDNGAILAQIAMPEGARWCLGWNHSVRHFTVLDCYRHRAGNMELERSHQPDFAAGLGYTEGRGELASDGQGGYWIENINEPVPGNHYVLRVGSRQVDHRLLWQRDGKACRLSLSERAAGERVTLQLTKLDS